MKITKIKKPFIIAEAGVNHENNIKIAELLIKEASEGGASAIKFQTYKAEKIASKQSPSYWDTNEIKINSQYKLFKKYDKFNQVDYFKLKKICDHYKIEFMSTPFDDESAFFLNKIQRFFKIASADITNYPLIEQISKFKKPIIFSTGASNTVEINNVYKLLVNKKIQVGILHCILSYPTLYKDANLALIDFFKKKFNNATIGISDHSIPDKNMLLLTKAFDLGAEIIETHFTIKKFKGKKNNDHFHSIDKDDLIKLNDNIRLLQLIVGNKINRNVLPVEKKSRKFARRSIYTNINIKKGDIFNYKNLIPKRPGTGISPIYLKKIIGKKAKKNIKNDTQIKLNDF
jgi:sialic acid synthase SpsE|tara:strand:- start:517 stop:1551 length:1035 start_codon:yes stop_codon:yes gene_type:complete